MRNSIPSSDQPCTIICCDGWRLTTNSLQWIVERRQGFKWRKLHFVATKKAVLERIFREECIPLTPEARRAVDALPDCFKDWQVRDPMISISDPREKGWKRVQPLPSPNPTLSIKGERMKQNEGNASTKSHQARVPALFT